MRTENTYCARGLIYAVSGVGLFALFAYRAALNHPAELIIGILILLGFVYQSYSSSSLAEEK